MRTPTELNRSATELRELAHIFERAVRDEHFISRQRQRAGNMAILEFAGLARIEQNRAVLEFPFELRWLEQNFTGIHRCVGFI